jgi:hypothetical protein
MVLEACSGFLSRLGTAQGDKWNFCLITARGALQIRATIETTRSRNHIPAFRRRWRLPVVDLKSLPAKIGELTLDKFF